MPDLTFDTISGNMPTALGNIENDINTFTQNPNPTASDLFQEQLAVTKWGLIVSNFSTILKTLGDTLKNTLQKIS